MLECRGDREAFFPPADYRCHGTLRADPRVGPESAREIGPHLNRVLGPIFPEAVHVTDENLAARARMRDSCTLEVLGVIVYVTDTARDDLDILLDLEVAMRHVLAVMPLAQKLRRATIHQRRHDQAHGTNVNPLFARFPAIEGVLHLDVRTARRDGEAQGKVHECRLVTGGVLACHFNLGAQSILMHDGHAVRAAEAGAMDLPATVHDVKVHESRLVDDGLPVDDQLVDQGPARTVHGDFTDAVRDGYQPTLLPQDYRISHGRAPRGFGLDGYRRRLLAGKLEQNIQEHPLNAAVRPALQDLAFARQYFSLGVADRYALRILYRSRRQGHTARHYVVIQFRQCLVFNLQRAALHRDPGMLNFEPTEY